MNAECPVPGNKAAGGLRAPQQPWSVPLGTLVNAGLMKLRQIADALGCRLTGGGDLEIHGVAGMEHASAGQLTFLANPKYAPKVKHTKASAILVAEALQGLDIACLVSDNPYLDFARALALFYQPPRPAPGVHPLAYVAPSATVGENASIGPFAVVGENVRIGRNAVLHPHVVVYRGAEIGDDFLAHSHATVREFCRIGNRVTLQNGVVIGGDGFGFAKCADGTQYKIVQSGVTILEDDVEIQIADLDRPRHGGRDADQTRRQDRQPGAGGPRLHGGRGQHHLCADGPRRQHRAGTQCRAGRAGGRPAGT